MEGHRKQFSIGAVIVLFWKIAIIHVKKLKIRSVLQNLPELMLTVN